MKRGKLKYHKFSFKNIESTFLNLITLIPVK